MAASTIEWAFTLILEQGSIFVHGRRVLFARLVNILYHQFVLTAVPTIFFLQVYVKKNWRNLWMNLELLESWILKLTADFTKNCRPRGYLAVFIFFFVRRNRFRNSLYYYIDENMFTKHSCVSDRLASITFTCMMIWEKNSCGIMNYNN